MPLEMCSASSAPVQTCWPFLATTVAVPVSWQKGRNALGGDLGVAEHGQSDAAVVGRGLLVVEDGGHLREVGGAEHEGAILHGLVGEEGEGFGFDDQHLLVAELLDLHEVGGGVELAVLGGVGPEGEHFLVFEGGSAHVKMENGETEEERETRVKGEIGKAGSRKRAELKEKTRAGKLGWAA
jgi:hypothetical protein